MLLCKKTRWALFSLFLVVNLLKAQEKQVIFEQYTYEDGLQSGIINDLTEDEDGLIWIASTEGLFKFDGYTFTNYLPIPDDSCSINSLAINCVTRSTRDDLLVGTSRGLLRRNPVNHCFERIFPINNDSPIGHVRDIIAVKDGYWWMTRLGLYASSKNKKEGYRKIDLPEKFGSPSSGLWIDERSEVVIATDLGLLIFNTSGKQFDFYPLPEAYVIDEIKFYQGLIYLATDKGILTFDLPNRKFTPSDWPGIVQQTQIKDLIFYHDQLWIATRGQGLLQVDPTTHVLLGAHLADIGNRASLTDIHVRRLFVDSHQNLWLGNFTGMNRTNTVHEKHPIYQTDPGFNSRTNFVIRMATDLRGGIWYYARSRGLYYSPKIGSPTEKMDFPLNEYLINKDVNFIYPISENEVWVLRGYQGIHRYRLDEKKWLPVITNPFLEKARLNTLINDPAREDICWITTNEGLLQLNKTTFEYELFLPRKDLPDLSRDLTYIAFPDPEEQKIWMGLEAYSSAKLGYFDLKTQSFHLIPAVKGLSTARYRDLKITSNGYLWATTALGLLKVNRKNFEAQLYTSNDGLRENSLIHLELDEKENIWTTSMDHIYQYSQDLQILSSTFVGPMEDFVNGCSGVLPDQTILFAGKNGICRVNPRAEIHIKPAEVILTDLSISKLDWQENIALEKATDLSLQYFNNSISFTFSAPQYFNQDGIQYAYRLVGFNDDWKFTSMERQGNYTNLSPGDYKLELKALNENYLTAPPIRRINIHIAAPWWKTNLAYLTYLLLSLGSIYLIYRFQLNKNLAARETEQLRQLDRLKTKFFTNITHEFRTPLSLILGPAQRLKNRFTGKDQKELNRIVDHGEHLLEMINQMLDLQRMKEGKMPVHPEQIDLVQAIKLHFDAFESKAREKNIDLKFSSQAASLPVLLDKNILRHALTNIISNAVKFTPEGGQIYLAITQSDAQINIAVRDSGPGIDPGDQEKLFERFEQLEHSQRVGKGSGIGLAFAKELVALLGGTIAVDSAIGQGATFIIRLKNEIIVPAKLVVEKEEKAQNISSENIDPNQDQILIVEDHDEMRQYIQECLAENFSIITAKNGQEGVEVARAQIPDLIISDVMMPVMNGYQLCAQLKSDIGTSHIPCILLTAKDSESSRLYGLNQGADDYLGKPFSEAELLLRIKNLLNLRQRIQQKMVLNQPFQSAPSPQEQKEFRFVQEIKALIEKQLSDPGFGVAQLADAIHLSRTQVNRKLQALLGISPSALILKLRMEQAKTLLADPSLNINEVAYQCGFSDSSYFTKVFQKETGVLPSKYKA